MPKEIDIEQLLKELPAILKHFVVALRNKVNFSKTVFAVDIHSMYSSALLYKCLIALGAKPENIFHCGKIYSNSPAGTKEIPATIGKDNFVEHSRENVIFKLFSEAYSAANKDMLRRVCERLKTAKEGEIETVILSDDGARLTQVALDRIDGEYSILKDYEMGVAELTTAGTRTVVAKYVEKTQTLPCAYVPVSSSAFKKKIEPTFISDATRKSLEACFPEIKSKNNLLIGIVGYGFIGKSIVNNLDQLNPDNQFLICDTSTAARASTSGNRSNKDFCQTLQELFTAKNCLILGATGKDVFADALKKPDNKFKEWIDSLDSKNPKTLASVSSENKEFFSLIKWAYDNKRIKEGKNAEGDDPLLKDLYILNNNGDVVITIKRAGYPINFMPPHYSVPRERIEPVIACLVGAMAQLKCIAKKPAATEVRGEAHLHYFWPEFQSAALAGLLENTASATQGVYSKDTLTSFTKMESVIAGSAYVHKKEEDAEFHETDTLYAVSKRPSPSDPVEIARAAATKDLTLLSSEDDCKRYAYDEKVVAAQEYLKTRYRDEKVVSSVSDKTFSLKQYINLSVLFHTKTKATESSCPLPPIIGGSFVAF